MRSLTLLFFWLILFYKLEGQIPQPLLSDSKATVETQNLFSGLVRVSSKGTLLGHHDDLAYGVGWRGQEGRSDIKSVTGIYPGLYGWDLSGLEQEKDKDINGIPFSDQTRWVKMIYERGGVNTFCWHMSNPVNHKSAWDTSIRTVAQILPGGAHHSDYIAFLDRISTYFSQLKGEKGESIPILFRPFHELTGTWFWWCQNTCSPEEFKSLWKFTVDYLRVKKNNHNLILVYSVSDFKTMADLTARYPGNKYVDIVGFDTYCRDNLEKFKSNLEVQMNLTSQFCRKNGKIAAIAETGYQGIPQAHWWTETWLPVLYRYPVSYIMLWRNGGPNHYFAPFPGQLSEGDFIQFAKNPKIIFQDRLTEEKLYQTGLKKP